jgi:hypothetical protein
MKLSTALRATNRAFHLTLALLAGLILTAALPAAAATFHVSVNGQSLALTEPATERGGRVFVPLRSIFESLGAGVAYDNGTINATAGDKTVQVKIGSNQAIVNGQQTYLDAAPYIVGATTMVPLRFVSEALGAEVNYDSNTGAIAIAAAKPPIANGSSINATLLTDVNTKSAYVGMPIKYMVKAPYPNNGALLAGATLYGSVLAVQSASQGRTASVELAVNAIQLAGSQLQQPITAKIVKIDVRQKSNITNEAGGTLAGMLIGNWIGKAVGAPKGQGGLIGAVGGYMLTSNSKQNLDVAAGSSVSLQLLDTLLLK